MFGRRDEEGTLPTDDDGEVGLRRGEMPEVGPRWGMPEATSQTLKSKGRSLPPSRGDGAAECGEVPRATARRGILKKI